MFFTDFELGYLTSYNILLSFMFAMARVHNNNSESAFFSLLGVLTYFSIKFGKSIGIENDVSNLKSRNFDAYCQCAVPSKEMIYSRGDGQLKL